MRVKEECWFCGKHVTPSKMWTVKLYKQFRRMGSYCSVTCAQRDSWGPIYRRSVIEKYKKSID